MRKPKKADMSNTQRNEKCEQRVDAAMADRLADLRTLLDRYNSGKECDGDLGRLAEYGLCFDYVEPGTFSGQREGYYRYQISWGGPSDEFRFFVNPDMTCHRIEYWFMDWFDGAHRVAAEQDEAFLLELWDWLAEGL